MSKGFWKRVASMLLVCLIILSTVVITCCSDESTGESPSSTGTTASPTETTPVTISQPSTQVKQEITVGLGRDAGGVYGGAHHLSNLTAVFENLVAYGYEMEIVPRLATSWETSEDELTWTFHLREGVTFHDGTPFTAEAAKYSLEMHDMKRPGHLGDLVSITAIDDYTLKITHTEPFAPLLYELAWPLFSMAPISAFDEEGTIITPIGTGPFMQEEWIPDEELVLVRYDDYWGDAPILEKITLVNIPDATTRLMALEAGEIDMIIDAGGVLPDDVSVIEDNPDLKVIMGTYSIGYYLTLNCLSEPFKDPNVRQAIQYAVDQESIVNDVLLGYGKVAESIITSDVTGWFYPGSEAVYDVDLAREMLEAAGWVDSDGDNILEKDGEEFNITFLVSSWSGEGQIAEVVQGQLSEVGINVDIVIVDSGVYYTVIKEEEGHDMLLLGYPFLGPNNVLYRSFHTTGDWNLRGQFYTNEEMDTLLELGKRTTDQEARVEIYAEVQKIVGEDNPIIPLYEGVLINAAKTSIEGYRIHPNFVVNWWDIYISE